MKSFKSIYEIAAQRKGGEQALQALLPIFKSKEEIVAISDDRFLSMMTRCVNMADFNWTVIMNKWPQFEEAFFQFNLDKLSMLPLEHWEAYTQDKRVVRNWMKINAVRDNCNFIRSVSAEYSCFGQFLASWPNDDQIGLMDYLKKHGSRLGGSTAQWFLRFMGTDSFMLSQDVCTALQQTGIDIADNPTSKRDRLRIQAAFNDWHLETNLPYSHISKVLSYSAGKNYPTEYIQEQMKKFG